MHFGASKLRAGGEVLINASSCFIMGQKSVDFYGWLLWELSLAHTCKVTLQAWTVFSSPRKKKASRKKIEISCFSYMYTYTQLAEQTSLFVLLPSQQRNKSRLSNKCTSPVQPGPARTLPPNVDTHNVGRKKSTRAITPICHSYTNCPINNHRWRHENCSVVVALLPRSPRLFCRCCCSSPCRTRCP